MYKAVVVLTMLILPGVSILLHHATDPGTMLIVLVGRWFVFWAVGVRLLIAGVRQYFQPQFTSRDLLGIESPDVHVLVRELGGANIGSGIVGLASLWVPSFVLPVAISAGFFYAVAAVEHARVVNRSTNETIALVSDIFASVVLMGFAVGTIARSAV